MKIDAISVTSKDLAKSIAFYSLLGLSFPEISPDEKHVEAVSSGVVRLMIDDAALIKSIIGVDPVPASHSSFAIKCDSPTEVDAVIKSIGENGYQVIKEPWDAFWGQRYAIVADPDGYMIDLFAQL